MVHCLDVVSTEAVNIPDVGCRDTFVVGQVEKPGRPTAVAVYGPSHFGCSLPTSCAFGFLVSMRSPCFMSFLTT